MTQSHSAPATQATSNATGIESWVRRGRPAMGLCRPHCVGLLMFG